MKILIVADPHIHSWTTFNLNKSLDLSRRLKEQRSILEQLVKISQEKKVGSVEIIGDIFHKVGEIPVVCLNIFDSFLSSLESLEIPVFITTGNHDLVLRENPSPLHKATTIFNRYQDNIYKDLKIKRIGYSETIDYDEVKGYDIVLLHKTPRGARYNNYVFTDGADWNKLSENNESVWFGHIHERQVLSSNCIVVGSPQQLTFGDKGDRGCYIYDTETHAREFIKLNYPEFITVDKIEDVKDDYNYYKVRNFKGELNKANVIAVSTPDFFKERLKSDTFDGILKEWLKLNKKDETYLLMLEPLLSDKFRLTQDVFKGILTSVSIKNFMSIESISYSVNSGFVLIKGSNEGFSSNGAGKTALFEAVYWVLFGETTKGLTGDDVIRRGQKDAEVRISLELNEDLYIISRSRKEGLNVILPDDIESKIIDNKFKSLREGDKQKALEGFLGFDKNIFLASCYFSQENLVVLTNMSDTERTNAITSLLGFEVYDDLYDAVFAQIKKFDEDVIKKGQERLEIEKLQIKYKVEIDSADEQYSNTQEKIEKVRKEIIELTNNLTALNSKVISAPKVEVIDYDKLFSEAYELKKIFENQIEGSTELRDAAKNKLHKAELEENSLQTTILSEDKKITLLENSIEDLSLSKFGERCQNCGSLITKENVALFIEEKKKELQNYLQNLEKLGVELNNLGIHCNSISAVVNDYDKEINSKTSKLNKVKEDIESLLAEKDEYQKKTQAIEKIRLELEFQTREINNSIKDCSKDIEELEAEAISYYEDKEKATKANDDCIKRIKELDWIIDKIKKGVDVLDFWKTSFSPKGIRALLLDKFCNEMNSILSDYISSISSGLMSLTIKPTSTIKSGEERNKLGLDIYMKGVLVKYESLSGGEKKRVDIALCLGLNAWISKRFGLRKGLLGFIILDELFSMLDASAEETIGSLLYQEGFQKAIFLISHTTELQNYSNTVWTVSKQDGISRLEETNGAIC